MRVSSMKSATDGGSTKLAKWRLRRFMQRGTVLFVSHDTASVVNLCQRAIWLENGRVERAGAPKGVANAYLRTVMQSSYGSEVVLSPIGRETDGAEPEAEEAAPPLIPDEPAPRIDVFDNQTDSTGWQTGLAEIVSLQFVDGVGNTVTSFEGGERATKMPSWRLIGHSC